MSRKYLYVSVVCSYGFHVLITFRYEMEQEELTNRTTRTTATVHAENNQDNKGINLLTMNSFIKTASHPIPCTSTSFCPPPMTLHPDRGCVLEALVCTGEEDRVAHDAITIEWVGMGSWVGSVKRDVDEHGTCRRKSLSHRHHYHHPPSLCSVILFRWRVPLMRVGGGCHWLVSVTTYKCS